MSLIGENNIVLWCRCSVR